MATAIPGTFRISSASARSASAGSIASFASVSWLRYRLGFQNATTKLSSLS